MSLAESLQLRALGSEVESSVSRRAYFKTAEADSWEEVWEAGPYYKRISDLLETARHYVVFVGWQIDSRLRLDGEERLKDKLIRICEKNPELQIYLLMWDHAYFYVAEREAWQGRIWDNVHPRIHFVFDNRHPFGGSHHEKLVLFDGTTAFCGGIDLCDERWDTPDHLFADRRRSLNWKNEHHGPYHDLAVQVRGPICAEIHEHIASRWRELSSVPFPDHRNRTETVTETETGHRVFLSRTRSTIDAGNPPIVREIEFLFRDLVRAARRQLIFEGQYYWSREINDLLIAKMHEMRGQDFSIVLVLADLNSLKSLTRHMAEHELSLLAQLERTAQVTGTRLIMGVPYSYPTRFGQTAKPVYIHSKVLICDDRLISIGSAHPAARALRVDSEVNLTFEARTPAERAHVREVAEHVLTHWGILPHPQKCISDIRLRQFRPVEEIRTYRRGLPPGLRWFARFPWQILFDPPLPWLYPLKRRFRLLSRRHAELARAVTAVAWLAGALLCHWLALRLEPEGQASALTLAYAAALSSAWLLRVPFTLTALWATLALGGGRGLALAVSGLWVSSVWGYAVTRMFPTASSRYFRATAPRWVPRQLGLRQFPALVSVVFDPRVGLRTKIAFEGLTCVPSPWFVLVNGALLPGALFALLRAVEPAARWLSPELGAAATRFAPYYLTAVALFALSRLPSIPKALWKPST